MSAKRLWTASVVAQAAARHRSEGENRQANAPLGPYSSRRCSDCLCHDTIPMVSRSVHYVVLDMDRPKLMDGQIFDLSQPLAPWSPRSSDHPQVTFESVRWRSRHGIRTSVLHTSVHVGTHIDAPAMYQHDGQTVDQLALDGLCGEAVIVDAPTRDWAPIGPDELNAGPDVHTGDIVVLRTGWHRHAHDEERYVLKAPGLTRAGVDWLVAKGIKLIASDSPSPEHIFMRSRTWKTLRPDVFDSAVIDPAMYPPSYGHKTFFHHGIPLLEGLGGDIDKLTSNRVQLVALPIRLEGVEAAPARVIAVV